MRTKLYKGEAGFDCMGISAFIVQWPTSDFVSSDRLGGFDNSIQMHPISNSVTSYHLAGCTACPVTAV